MTLQQLLDQGTEQLRSAGVPDAGLDARYLLLDTFGLGLASFLADRGRNVDGLPGGAEKAQAYEALIARRAARIPRGSGHGFRDVCHRNQLSAVDHRHAVCDA